MSPAPLRTLVLLLALLQLAAPTGYALAEPAPPPTSHQEHLGTRDDDGCRPFHDEAFCGSCRVLSNHPLQSDAGPRLAPQPVRALTGLRSSDTGAPAGPPLEQLHARAPPRI